MSIVDDQLALVARIEETGLSATHDPRVAANAKSVIVLVQPPIRDYVHNLQTWSLAIVRNTTDTGAATTKALGEALALLEGSSLPIEDARPGGLRYGPERPPVPAYFVTVTTT